MNKYNVVFSRLYEIEAENEEEAETWAITEFDADIEFGFASANNDGFSVKVTKV
jgi:hypothetical protein